MHPLVGSGVKAAPDGTLDAAAEAREPVVAFRTKVCRRNAWDGKINAYGRFVQPGRKELEPGSYYLVFYMAPGFPENRDSYRAPIFGNSSCPELQTAVWEAPGPEGAAPAWRPGPGVSAFGVYGFWRGEDR